MGREVSGDFSGGVEAVVYYDDTTPAKADCKTLTTDLVIGYGKSERAMRA